MFYKNIERQIMTLATQIYARVTHNERDFLEKQAKNKGLTLSRYIREKLGLEETIKNKRGKK